MKGNKLNLVLNRNKMKLIMLFFFFRYFYFLSLLNGIDIDELMTTKMMKVFELEFYEKIQSLVLFSIFQYLPPEQKFQGHFIRELISCQDSHKREREQKTRTHTNETHSTTTTTILAPRCIRSFICTSLLFPLPPNCSLSLFY